MKFTNKQNIPKGIYRAIATDHYSDPTDKPSDYSVTKIISPIQQTTLSQRYNGTPKIPTRDILDNYNAWIGSVIHNAIEDASKADKDTIAERRFYTLINGIKISGKVDAIIGDTITDYKTCKVYKIMKMDTLQWEEQANCYRLLAHEAGIEINHLQVEAIMIDWKPKEALIKKNQGYPQCPIQVVPLKVWSLDGTREWMKQRVALLENAKKATDDELYKEFACTREEQWSSIKDISIFKKGSARATKVCHSESEANEVFASSEKFTVETHEIRTRYTPRTRCLDYCDCKNVCKQFKEEEAV